MTAMFLKLKLKTKSVSMKICDPYIFFQNLFSLSHHIAIYIYINAAAIFPYAAGIECSTVKSAQHFNMNHFEVLTSDVSVKL